MRVKKMVHYTQQLRRNNIEACKIEIARAMPVGIHIDKLRAFLMRKHGFSYKKTEEYLNVLLCSGEADNNSKTGIWKLVTPKLTKKKAKK